MKYLMLLAMSTSLMAGTCHCPNCRCTPQNHCGCHSDEGCSCDDKGRPDCCQGENEKK